MGIRENLQQELKKRETDLAKIPTEVLERINANLDTDTETEEALQAWREPSPNGAGQFYCNCTSDKYQSGGDYSSIDCWLCGGYTY